MNYGNTFVIVENGSKGMKQLEDSKKNKFKRQYLIEQTPIVGIETKVSHTNQERKRQENR